MRRMRELIKDWMPPVIFRMLQRFMGRSIVFEGNYASWEEAAAKSSGYDADHILANVLASTLKVKRGEAAFERDSVLFDEIEYAWPVLAGLMLAAARNGGILNILDFGGSLGSSYFQSRTFLQGLSEFRWNIVEQTHYVQVGQKCVQDGHLRFYPTIESCLLENKPNVVLLSSVLQYLKSPDEVINLLSSLGISYLIIDRTPFSLSDADTLVIQHVPDSTYVTSYPMWVFSAAKFEKVLDKNWNLVAKNLSPEGYVQTTNKFSFSFQGMLLESRQ